MDRDIEARASGEISSDEYFDRAGARAAGGAAGLAILAGERSPSTLRGILTFASKRAIERQLSKRPDGVPKDWARRPSKDGKGYEWWNPRNEHDSVRTSPGNPNSSQAGQREPYVARRSDGKRYNSEGREVPKKSEESHISPSDYTHKSSEELRKIN